MYVAVFACSLFALIDLLAHFDVTRLSGAFRLTMPVRAIAGFLGVMGLFFLVAWLAQIVPPLLRGEIPAIVTLAKTPTGPIYVRDLGIIMPLFFTAAVWLWQRRAWGFALAAIMPVLADLMLIALIAMGIFSALAGLAGALDLMAIWVVLGIASLCVTWLFFAHMEPHTEKMPGETAGQQRVPERAREPEPLAMPSW